MFGPRITTVFANRWKALWWSAGILMTAYCSVPSSEDTGAAQTKVAAHHEAVNPWALDKK